MTAATEDGTNDKGAGDPTSDNSCPSRSLAAAAAAPTFGHLSGSKICHYYDQSYLDVGRTCAAKSASGYPGIQDLDCVGFLLAPVQRDRVLGRCLWINLFSEGGVKKPGILSDPRKTWCARDDRRLWYEAPPLDDRLPLTQKKKDGRSII